MKTQKQKHTRVYRLVTFGESKPVYRNAAVSKVSFSLTQGPYHKYLMQAYECSCSPEIREQLRIKAQEEIGEPLWWILTNKTVPYFDL